MADYYVRTTGSNVANGTSPATAWLTLAHAMNNVADGDTIWVGAGTYRIGASYTPPNRGAMTYLIGDTDGSKTGDAGEIVVTNITSETAAAAAALLFYFNSRSYWTLENLTLVAGGGVDPITLNGTAANITIRNCLIYSLSSPSAIVLSTGMTFGSAMNVTIERCRLWARGTSGGQTLDIYLPTSASGNDVHANIVVRNNLILGSYGQSNSSGIRIQAGSGAKKTGGVEIYNNLVLGGSAYSIWRSSAGNSSTIYPITVRNNVLMTGGTGVQAFGVGEILSNYNLINAGTDFSNVTAGANDNTNLTRHFRFSFGHEDLFGGRTRPFGEPVAGIPALSWGGQSVASNDLRGMPRAMSGTGGVLAAVGPMERADNGIRETTTVPPAAGEALRIKGPGYQEFELAVGSNATTVGVQARYDSAYAGILPQLWVVNGGEAGVAATSNTMTAAANTWEKVTVGPFTPSKNGIVTVRLQSNSTGSNSNAYFGSFSLE